MNLIALALLQSFSFGAPVAQPAAPAIAVGLRHAAIEAVAVAPALDAQAQLVTTASVAATAAEYPAAWPRVFEDRATGKYFGARYFASKVGRFTTVDPVYTWKENLVDPQRWNRYAYVRNNPLRYVDPDGREIALAAGSSTGDRQFLTNALTEVAMRAGGREFLTALIESSSTIVFGVGSVNDAANIDAARKGQPVGLTFGTATFLDPTTDQVTITIDRQALREFASRTKPGLDSSGVTTTAHEIYHARDALSGRPQQFAAGDRPTSATGPAERFGQSTRREKKDLPKSEARRAVTEALERKQQ